MVNWSHKITITFFFQISLHKKVDYYCDVCEVKIKKISKSKHFESLAHNELENCMHFKHTIKNPVFFEIDKKFNVYVAYNIEKFVSFLDKHVLY